MILQESDIQNLLAPIIKAYKKADIRLNSYNYEFSVEDLPDFFPNYKLAIKNRDRILIHSECGKFPAFLFVNRFPTQTDKEFEYMKANYKQNTLPVFIDYISTNTRPFSDGNWNIQYEPDDDLFKSMGETFQKYVDEDIEMVRSLKSHTKSLLPSIKAIDAMGVIAIKPQEIYSVAGEDGTDETVDNTVLVNPQPYYYSCKNVLTDPKYDDDYFIIELDEKSVVEYGGQRVNRGHVFEIYDEENIWRVEQTGKFIEYQFKVSVYFQHNKGEVPVTRLKGIPHYNEGGFIWKSPFLFACDLLDLALMNSNYLQCTVAHKMFPYLVTLGNKCNYRETGVDGMIISCDSGKIFRNGNYGECPSCHGTGLADRISPVGGKLVLSPSDLNNEGELKYSGSAMYYVSPETSSSEFVQTKIEKDLALAYEIIKAKRTSQSTAAGINPQNATATENILDLKAMYAAVKFTCDQTFDIYAFELNHIGWQRYRDKFKKPTLNYPVSFDFNTEKDYLDQLKTAQEAHLAPSILQPLVSKYLEVTYFNDPTKSQAYKLILETDRLFVLSQDDILMKQAKGLAADWEIILHDSATQFIDELILEKADIEMCSVDDCSRGFFALDFKDQQNLLIEKAKEKANNIKPMGGTLLQQSQSRLGIGGGGNGR